MGDTAETQMQFLMDAIELGDSLEGYERGAIAYQLRIAREHFDLEGLFATDEGFMNENLRDFMNIKEDGTMSYNFEDLTEGNGWTQMASIGAQYHQTNAGKYLNAKFVNTDGREVIINYQFQVVNSYPDRGTYNFVNGTASNSIGDGAHRQFDILPYNRLMDRLGIEVVLKYDMGNALMPNSQRWP